MEYDPVQYKKLIRPIVEGKADVVYGSRFVTGDYRRVLYFWHMVGNSFLTLLSNMFTNLNLTDMETCYKVFRREVLEKITIEENRFGFEPEITAKLQNGCENRPNGDLLFRQNVQGREKGSVGRTVFPPSLHIEVQFIEVTTSEVSISQAKYDASVNDLWKSLHCDRRICPLSGVPWGGSPAGLGQVPRLESRRPMRSEEDDRKRGVPLPGERCPRHRVHTEIQLNRGGER